MSVGERKPGAELATILVDDDDDPRAADASRPDRVALPGRYVDLGTVGSGSFGEVRRARDVALDRVVVLKLLRPEHVRDSLVRWRFSAEVRVTAALQHPGVVPVYDHGELADGTLWYAMKEVRGRTFGAILNELRGASASGSGWTFRRLIEAFARVAQTIAFAHARGVIHRDLKPENLMAGEFGEVLVMDWGLAAKLDETAPSEPRAASPTNAANAALTRAGDVLGTPAYMPREQALGARAQHGRHSDVYSLGAILFHVLTGRPPFVGSAREVIAQLLREPPPSVASALDDDRRDEVPAELCAACERAMRVEPADRGSAEQLAEDVVAWLDGANKRERALAALSLARAREPEIARLRAIAAEATDAARARWSTLRAYDAVDAKRPAWELEDVAERARRDAAIEEAQWLEAVHGALTVDPLLPEARDALAQQYRDALCDAERAGSVEDAARFEALLRANDRGIHRAFLDGDGSLSLRTEPAGARVTVARFALRDRRLVADEPRALSATTPLFDHRLPFGSYLLELCAEGCAPVRYPIEVARDGRWISAPDDGDEPWAIELPAARALGERDVWIAGGWAWLGGDPSAPDSLSRRRVWIDSFVLRRDPVTVGEYLEFCDDLAARGRLDEALAHRPTAPLRAKSDGTESPFVLQKNGRFEIVGDDLWAPDVPVVSVTWRAAMAYARWYAERTGLQWRLPDEFEREKAARGVDGRLWPWGHHGDPSFACVLEGHRDEPRREPIGAHPLDVSVYGVRGLAGNTHDWCANVWRHDGPTVRDGRLVLERADDDDPEFRAIRGGAWSQPFNGSRAAARFGARPELGRRSIGFRLARSPR
jgi:formylglycine-generating enzyme required for sulfatase activity/tRNA A-37 threonylcarbamoyl transferase component Bud32